MPNAHRSILITGPTFITEAHLEKLARHGIQAERLEALTATEDLLVERIAGKHGYILGGLERVTERVIDAGDKLEAICFTGAGWTEFIPAHEEATRRGIAIAAAPGANAQAVAELAVGLIHDRVRNISYLSGQGFGERIRGRNMRGLTLGIVGAGNVGSKVARIVNGAYGTRILYTSPKRNLDLEYATGALSVSLGDLLATADVVSLHVRKTPSTTRLIDAEALGAMRDGAILVNTAFADAIDPPALFDELARGRISAALDVVFQHVDSELPDFRSISSQYLLQMGVQSGFNTVDTVGIASDVATDAMISLLEHGVSQSAVNPQFVDNR